MSDPVPKSEEKKAISKAAATEPETGATDTFTHWAERTFVNEVPLTEAPEHAQEILGNMEPEEGTPKK